MNLKYYFIMSVDFDMVGGCLRKSMSIQPTF
jgi:hypothetical protein